jgi:type II restriction enzyme
MPTPRQVLGRKGEIAVRDHVPCPRCRRSRHLVPLTANFQCADLICKFCGFLAQVKATRSVDGRLPMRILGAAWRPQHEQILAGIFQPLFIAVFDTGGRLTSIHYVPAHILQSAPTVFEPRDPLSATAKRPGWTGFNYNLSKLPPIGVEEVFRASEITRPATSHARSKPTKSVPRRPRADLTLHEAMREVLRSSGNRPMSPAELTDAVNKSGLYARGDGLPVPRGQVAARRAKYGHMFVKTPAGIRLADEQSIAD